MGKLSTSKSDDNQNKPGGIILRGVSGEYTVLTDSGDTVTAKPRGIIRKNENTPYPGDRVILSETGDDKVTHSIESILERKSFIRRPAIANLDVMIITCAAKNPRVDLRFVDKMIIICKKEKITPSVCITKADLDPESASEIKNEYKNIGIPVFLTGIDIGKKDDFIKLKEYIGGKIVSFAGQSGVGKSTLLNKIMQRECMATGDISNRNKKGKHTTRHSEIFTYLNGFIADTPGFSSIGFLDLDVTGEDVLRGYPEIEKYNDRCMFSDCRHLGEKGCAVTAETEQEGRIVRYREFRKEADAILSHEYKNKKNGG